MTYSCSATLPSPPTALIEFVNLSMAYFRLYRILAHAGFDARKAVSFWQERDEAEVSECSPKRAEEYAAGKSSLARRIMGSTHPQHSQRVARLKAELDRWETKRMKALQQLSRTFARTDIQDQTSTS